MSDDVPEFQTARELRDLGPITETEQERRDEQDAIVEQADQDVRTDGGVQSTSETERDYEKGPNGFPYVDVSEVKLGGWANGDYRFELVREDGERLIAALTPEQMAGLVEMVADVHEEHEAAMQEDREVSAETERAADTEGSR